MTLTSVPTAADALDWNGQRRITGAHALMNALRLHGVDTIIHSITGLKSYFVYQDWLFIKLGMVIMILGGLIVIDQKLGFNDRVSGIGFQSRLWTS